MRTFPFELPAWRLATMVGLPAGLLMTVGDRYVSQGSWTEALVSGAVVAVLLGGILLLGANRQRGLIRAAAGDLDQPALAAASRAAVRGPVPTDPQVRAAALDIATKQLRVVERPVVRILLTVAFSLGAIATIGAVAGGFGWLALLPAATTLSLGSQLHAVRRLRARIRQLSA
jgi:hypothetical protein